MTAKSIKEFLEHADEIYRWYISFFEIQYPRDKKGFSRIDCAMPQVVKDSVCGILYTTFRYIPQDADENR